MTPAEINGRIESHGAKLESKMINLDTLAWMIGNYCAHAYHDPKKYPKKPSMMKNKVKMGEPMDEEDMKQILTAYAGTHNTIEGVR